MIEIKQQVAADVPTPSAGRVSAFVDAAGVWNAKKSDGTVERMLGGEAADVEAALQALTDNVAAALAAAESADNEAQAAHNAATNATTTANAATTAASDVANNLTAAIDAAAAAQSTTNGAVEDVAALTLVVTALSERVDAIDGRVTSLETRMTAVELIVSPPPPPPPPGVSLADLSVELIGTYDAEQVIEVDNFFSMRITNTSNIDAMGIRAGMRASNENFTFNGDETGLFIGNKSYEEYTISGRGVALGAVDLTAIIRLNEVDEASAPLSVTVIAAPG